MKRPVPMGSKLAAKRIGENLATWRKLYRVTSQQLAEQAGISRATVSRLENGDPTVSYAAFLNVCRVLVTLDAVVAASPALARPSAAP